MFHRHVRRGGSAPTLSYAFTAAFAVLIQAMSPGGMRREGCNQVQRPETGQSQLGGPSGWAESGLTRSGS
eukprot:2205802-Rhodomonas_salina.2